MTDAKMRTLDTIQLKRQTLNFQSYPKPKKHFVCLYGKTYKDTFYFKKISLLYFQLCV